MVAPHYIAKRVGEEYVLVRVDPVAQVGRMVAGATGLGLLSHAVARRGLFSAVGGLAGVGMLYYAFTGRNPVGGMCCDGGAQHGSQKDTPSFSDEPKRGDDVHQVPADPLEEAQMESFPASDPPALHTESKPKTVPA